MKHDACLRKALLRISYLRMFEKYCGWSRPRDCRNKIEPFGSSPWSLDSSSQKYSTQALQKKQPVVRRRKGRVRQKTGKTSYPPDHPSRKTRYYYYEDAQVCRLAGDWLRGLLRARLAFLFLAGRSRVGGVADVLWTLGTQPGLNRKPVSCTSASRPTASHHPLPISFPMELPGCWDASLACDSEGLLSHRKPRK